MEIVYTCCWRCGSATKWFSRNGERKPDDRTDKMECRCINFFFLFFFATGCQCSAWLLVSRDDGGLMPITMGLCWFFFLSGAPYLRSWDFTRSVPNEVMMAAICDDYSHTHTHTQTNGFDNVTEV